MKSTLTRKNPGATARINAQFLALARLEVAQGWTDQQDPDDVTIAAINYFGSEDGAHPPPRDALAPAVETTKDAAIRAGIAAGRSANRGALDKSGLETLAKDAGENLKSEIRAFDSPGNARSTIAAKGFNNPLIGVGGGRILDSAGAILRDRR